MLEAPSFGVDHLRIGGVTTCESHGPVVDGGMLQPSNQAKPTPVAKVWNCADHDAILRSGGVLL